MKRREFVQSIATVGVGATLAQWASAEDAPLNAEGIRLDSSTAPLVKLLEETPRDDLPDMLVRQLARGVPERKLIEAIFLFPVLWQGHHSVYIVHAARQLSLDLPREDRMLPFFWAVDVMKEHLTRFQNRRVEPVKGKLPSRSKALVEFTDAMEAMDAQRAEHAVIGLSRTIGPEQTYRRVLSFAARDQSFIGHIPIAIVNAGRLLPVIGWRHAEVVLRWMMQQMYGRRLYPLEKQPYPHNVERVKSSLERLPAGWTSSASNRAAVLELYELILKWKWWKANEWIVEEMAGGRITAGAAWDAIHLACADMMICHKQGGDRLGNRALHSNTAVNALHFVFRNSSDDESRLLVLFQAVALACEFRYDELNRELLRDLRVVDMEASDVASADTAVESIMASLPPREFLKSQPDRTGQDAAARTAFSLASAFPNDPTLLSAARRSMSRRLTLDAHEMKYPVAMLEDLSRVSPEWRPHLTAALVVYLQGANSENNPAVTRGLAALRDLRG